MQDQQADDSAKPAAAPSELGDADLDLLASLNAAGDSSTSPAHELWVKHCCKRKVLRSRGLPPDGCCHRRLLVDPLVTYFKTAHIKKWPRLHNQSARITPQAPPLMTLPGGPCMHQKAKWLLLQNASALYIKFGMHDCSADCTLLYTPGQCHVCL